MESGRWKTADGAEHWISVLEVSDGYKYFHITVREESPSKVVVDNIPVFKGVTFETADAEMLALAISQPGAKFERVDQEY